MMAFVNATRLSHPKYYKRALFMVAKALCLVPRAPNGLAVELQRQGNLTNNPICFSS